jgi:hypothetical protein
MRKINGILKRDLEKLYVKKKMSTYRIAEYYKCSQATIWKLLHEHNIFLRRPGKYIDIPYLILKKLYVEKKMCSRKIATIYNCAYSTIDRKIKRNNFKIRNLAQAHIIYPRKSFSGNLFEKAYLIGFCIGDLRARKVYKNSETIVIDCGSTQLQQIKLINNIFKPYGRVWISKKDAKGRRQIQAHLDLSFSFLLNLGANTNIDYWIQDNRDYFSAFLAGFTDAEGSFYISSGKAFYSLGNYNVNILNQIYKKLMELAIYCSKPRSDNLKGYKDREGYIRRQEYWSLCINKKQALIDLFKLIEPHLKHDKRKADMDKAKRNIVERNRKFGNLRMSHSLKQNGKILYHYGN